MESDRPSSGRDRPAAVPAGWATGPAPAPSESVQTTIDEMTSQMRAVIDAAERAADAIRLDAEEQARRHLAEAQRKADRLTAERVELISELTDDLIRHAANVRDHSEQMVRALEDAIGSFADRLEHPRLTQSFAEEPSGNGQTRPPEREAGAFGGRPSPPSAEPRPEPYEPAPPEPVPAPVGAPAEPHAGADAAAYTDVIGAPPPPPPATAPPPVPGYRHPAEPAGPPQPTADAAAEAAASHGEEPRGGDADPEIPLDVVMYATRRAANGAAPEVIASELRLRYGVEDPAPILDRVMGQGGRPGRP